MANKNLDKQLSKKKQNLRVSGIAEKLVSDGSISMTKKTLDNVKNCNDYVAFVGDVGLDKLKKVGANSCKNRFCPICSYTKACKDALELSVMLQYLSDAFSYRFLFVTLTVPNVRGNELDDKIKQMNEAFNRFKGYSAVKKAYKGMVRKLEVTYNRDTDMYHPHFHLLIAVNKSYFDSRDYIKRDDLLALWQKAVRDDTITQVDVRAVKKGQEINAVLEMAKYVSKDSDYAINNSVFKVFYNALKNKRLINFLGAFKDAKSLYDKGELDKYKEEDDTVYKWLLHMFWQSKDEVYKMEKEELTEAMINFYGLNKINSIDVDAL